MTTTTSRPGTWWLSDRPKEERSGTLELGDADVFELTLIGKLQGPRPSEGRSILAQQVLHGISGGRNCSLLAAHWVGQSSNLISERRNDSSSGSQKWNGYIFVDGQHILDSTIFPDLTFEIPNSDYVWTLSNMKEVEGLVDLDEIHGDVRKRILYTSASGVEIAGSNLRTSNYEQKSISATETWTYQLSKSGLSLDATLRNFVFPLEVLVGVLTNRGTAARNFRIVDRGTGATTQITLASNRKVDVKFAHSSLRDDGETIEGPLDKLCQNWIAAAPDLVLPMALVDPGRETTAFLSNRVVELVNAAELLHRTFCPDAMEYSESDLFILAKLESDRPSLGLNSKHLSRIKGALRVTSRSLESRLIELFELLDADFVEWYFSGHVRDFCLVAANVRNALSHGYATKHRVESEMPVLAALESVMTAVIKLIMLVRCLDDDKFNLRNYVMSERHHESVLLQTMADWSVVAHRVRNS